MYPHVDGSTSRLKSSAWGAGAGVIKGPAPGVFPAVGCKEAGTLVTPRQLALTPVMPILAISSIIIIKV